MPFPIDEKYIKIAEAELGSKFPDSFRNKMIIKNGGEVEVLGDSFQLLPFYDMSEKKRIKRTCNSIVHETKMAHTHYGLPSNLIVIGDNGCGDVLVYKIHYGGFISPKIYCFNHETEEIEFVANDFIELKLS